MEQILVTITDSDYEPEDGTPFDAVVSALEHFEIPSHLVEVEEGRKPQGFTTSVENEEKSANARLIAAAPDLLDALKAMLGTFGTTHRQGTGSNRFQLATEGARSAIAIAEGRHLDAVVDAQRHGHFSATAIDALEDCVGQMEQCERMFRDDEEFMSALNKARKVLGGAA